MRPIGAFIAVSLLIPGALAQAADRPVVTRPAAAQKVGADGDTVCPKSEPACFRIEAEGRVPKGTHAFFAVEPELWAPRLHIQPRIHSIGDDGSVNGSIYLGNEVDGVGEFFRIYLLACKTDNPFDARKIVLRVPATCEASSPVRVYRVR